MSPLGVSWNRSDRSQLAARRTTFADGPVVRRIAERARSRGYRMTEFILGVVESEPKIAPKKPIPRARIA